jgi:predicted DNA-binding transcriptional regulator YafY
VKYQGRVVSETSTALRYLSMLSHVPCRPRKVTARELAAKLNADGFDIHTRSIERDLHKLSSSGQFPLVSDEGRPAGWSWRDRDARLTFPQMDAGTALTCELVSRYLKPVLPRAMARHLEADFAQARRTLNQLGATPLGKWSKRIAVLPQGHQLLPPRILDGVSEVVYEALLKGKRFEADYLALDAGKEGRYVFNPQGLVYRQGVLYLVATLWDYEDVRQFALHRMANATLLVASAVALEGFDLQQYVEDEKGFDLPAGRKIVLELRVVSWLAQHLDECRLAMDQTIKPLPGPDQTFRVRATLVETEQMYWWLRSLGPEVEVLRPVALRRRMAGDLNAAARLYAKSASHLRQHMSPV